MKTTKTILGNGLIMLTAAFIMSFTTPAVTAIPSESAVTSDVCGVSNTDVSKYLQRNGYSVVALTVIEGGCDREATTQNPYKTVVFVEEGIIVGHEDRP